jgi:hypothetical protein
MEIHQLIYLFDLQHKVVMVDDWIVLEESNLEMFQSVIMGITWWE